MRALKFEYGTHSSKPSEAASADATPAPAGEPAAPVATPAPIAASAPVAPPAPLPLARALENAVASVIAGASSRLVLTLTEDGSELEASFLVACETTRRRALHVRLAAGPQVAERAYPALVAALRERTSGRPGAAVLLDPLVRKAASFVLGSDFWSLEAFLKPEALDEVPAVASRVLLTRFVPALAAQLPDVPRELLAALLAERTGSDEHSLAAIASTLAGPELLRALSLIAARVGVALVFTIATATDCAAASALEAATMVADAPHSVLWALGARRDAWEVQRSLLDDGERRRVEVALAPPPVEPLPAAPAELVAATPSEPAASPPGVANAPTKPAESQPTMGANLSPRARAAARRASSSAEPTPAAPAPAAEAPKSPPRLEGRDETPPLAIPLPLRLKAGFSDHLKKQVKARLANPKKSASQTFVRPSRPTRSAPARSSSFDAHSGAWVARPRVDAQPTGLKRVAIVALPFLFLASLGVFARRETDFRAQRGPTPDWVIKMASAQPPAAKPAAPAPAPVVARPAPTPAPARPAKQPAPVPPGPAAAPKALPPPPPSRPHPNARRGLHVASNAGANAAPAHPAPARTTATPAMQPAPGASVQDRLVAAERMPQGNEQLAAFCQLYDSRSDSELDQSLLKRGVLLRLAPYRNEPEALDRILKALDGNSPRELRLTAIQALSIGNTPIAPAARSRLQTIVSEDADEAVKSSAQIALAAQPR